LKRELAGLPRGGGDAGGDDVPSLDQAAARGAETAKRPMERVEILMVAFLGVDDC